MTEYGSNYQSDGFLTKWDATGQFIWARQIGGEDLDEINGLERDRAGYLYVLGTFKQKAYFTPDTTGISLTMSGASTRDVFLAKYSDSGSLKWVQQFGTIDFNDGRGLYVDGSANVYLTGNYSTMIDCDPDTSAHWVASGGLHDVFVVKLHCADTSSANIEMTLCADSFLIAGKSYTTDGDYTVVIPNAAGCDSTIRLRLQLKGAIAKPFINVDGFELGITDTFYSYQWLLNNESLSGAKNKTYQVTQNGDYRVVVFNAKGCSDTSDIYSIRNVSLQGYTPAVFAIYPNPVQDQLFLKSQEPLDASLLDIQGRILWTGKKVTQIPMRDLGAGIYYISIRDQQQHHLQTIKVVKVGS